MSGAIKVDSRRRQSDDDKADDDKADNDNADNDNNRLSEHLF